MTFWEAIEHMNRGRWTTRIWKDQRENRLTYAIIKGRLCYANRTCSSWTMTQERVHSLDNLVVNRWTLVPIETQLTIENNLIP